MEQHGLLQEDLVDVFGTRSIVSEVLSGKRELNKEQIARLSARFRVSPELFFWSNEKDTRQQSQKYPPSQTLVWGARLPAEAVDTHLDTLQRSF